MADLLADGLAWLEQQRHEHLSGPVTYHRGAAELGVQATAGRTVFRLHDAYGATVRYVSRDYLIRAEDLVLDGEALVPQRGDEIRQVLPDGRQITCQVMGPGGGEPDWRYSDGQRTTLRIHTKEV